MKGGSRQSGLLGAVLSAARCQRVNYLQAVNEFRRAILSQQGPAALEPKRQSVHFKESSWHEPLNPEITTQDAIHHPGFPPLRLHGHFLIV